MCRRIVLGDRTPAGVLTLWKKIIDNGRQRVASCSGSCSHRYSTPLGADPASPFLQICHAAGVERITTDGVGSARRSNVKNPQLKCSKIGGG
jgi:hypothetical protein